MKTTVAMLLPGEIEPDSVEVRGRALSLVVDVDENHGATETSYNDLYLSFSTGKVSFKGKELDVSVRHFQILEMMVREPTRVFSEKDFSDWLGQICKRTNFSSHIALIRKRFREIDPNTDEHWFRNRWGRGWVLYTE